jgi:hypothetical protein
LEKYLKSVLWVLVVVVVSFWVGVIYANVFPGLNEKPLKMLIDTAVAIGTVGAVIVALRQMAMQQDEAQSRICLDEAKQSLEHAFNDFLAKSDKEGRPIGERRHWLTFARGILVAKSFADRITNRDMRQIWEQTEHYWRDRLFDVLEPTGESYPADYYGYMDDKDFMTNYVQGPGDRAPVAEQSAAFVYRWVRWPNSRPDPLDRTLKFTDSELENMGSFGPRGLGRYISKLRIFLKNKS